MSTRPAIRFSCAVLFVFGAFLQLPAQTAVDTKAMGDALQLRASAATAVASGKVPPAEAMGQLRAMRLPMGIKMDADTGFALAAIDIGQRLIAIGKPAAAEPFFSEAEKSLGTAIDKTPDSAAHDKAVLLENRAFVRDNFLNKTPGADADLAKAAALQPEDKHLQRKRDLLSAAKAGRAMEQSNAH